LIDVLAKGHKSNAAYFLTEILSSLSKWRSARAKEDKQKLIMHTDNARPHTAQPSAQFFGQYRMKTAPHPPQSVDIAPSDFYLFGHVKGCLAALSCERADELFEAVQGALEGIDKGTLQVVFLGRMDRLRKCIAANGEYHD
jgi:hypothetical protein